MTDLGVLMTVLIGIFFMFLILVILSDDTQFSKRTHRRRRKSMSDIRKRANNHPTIHEGGYKSE